MRVGRHRVSATTVGFTQRRPHRAFRQGKRCHAQRPFHCSTGRLRAARARLPEDRQHCPRGAAIRARRRNDRQLHRGLRRPLHALLHQHGTSRGVCGLPARTGVSLPRANRRCAHSAVMDARLDDGVRLGSCPDRHLWRQRWWWAHRRCRLEEQRHRRARVRLPDARLPDAR